MICDTITIALISQSVSKFLDLSDLLAASRDRNQVRLRCLYIFSRGRSHHSRIAFLAYRISTWNFKFQPSTDFFISFNSFFLTAFNTQAFTSPLTANSFFLTTQHLGFHLTRDWCSMCHRWKRSLRPPSVSKKLRKNAKQQNSTDSSKVCVVVGYFSGCFRFGLCFDPLQSWHIFFGCLPWR